MSDGVTVKMFMMKSNVYIALDNPTRIHGVLMRSMDRPMFQQFDLILHQNINSVMGTILFFEIQLKVRNQLLHYLTLLSSKE